MDILFMPTPKDVEEFSTVDFEKKVQENGEAWLMEQLKGMDGVILAIRLLNYTAKKSNYYNSTLWWEGDYHTTKTHMFGNELTNSYEALVRTSSYYSRDKGIPYFGYLYSIAPKRLANRTFKTNDRLEVISLDRPWFRQTHDGELTNLVDALPNIQLHQSARYYEDVEFAKEMLYFIARDADITKNQREVLMTMADNPEWTYSEVEEHLGRGYGVVGNHQIPRIREVVANTYTLGRDLIVNKKVNTGSVN